MPTQPLTKATAPVEQLTQWILAKAFRGELVPTEAKLAPAEGRNFESAEDLLSRISWEMESLTGARQTKVPLGTLKVPRQKNTAALSTSGSRQ